VIWPLPALIIAVIGSIYGGIATATEAACLGAFFALLIAFVRGRLTWKAIRDSISETLVSTASIFFVAIGAMLLTRFLAFAGVPFYLSEQVINLGLSPLGIILAISVIYLILGCFLDGLGVMLLTLPVLFPVMKQTGIDPIWAGVIIVKYLEIGMMTPPVGLNVYVVKGVVGDKIPLTTIFRGVGWYLVAETIIMALIISLPVLSTFLPYQMLYR